MKAFDLFRAARLVKSKQEMRRFTPKINGEPVLPDDEPDPYGIAWDNCRVFIDKFGPNIFHLQLSKKEHALVRVGDKIERVL